MAIFTKNPKFDWIFRCGLKGLCPRCAKASMFNGWLKLQKTCPECGLNYDFANADDGPAFFALCIGWYWLTSHRARTVCLFRWIYGTNVMGRRKRDPTATNSTDVAGARLRKV